MKTSLVALGTLVIGIVAGALIGRLPASDSKTIAEGVIWSLEYRLENGRAGGFTRMNLAAGVPGGTGSWNVDAYGKLTRDFLIITYRQQKDLGPRIIPTHRLLDIQFLGNGEIPPVASEPAKPN